METNNYYTLRQTFWGKSRDPLVSLDRGTLHLTFCAKKKKMLFGSVLPSLSDKLNVVVQVRIPKDLWEWVNIEKPSHS